MFLIFLLLIIVSLSFLRSEKERLIYIVIFGGWVLYFAGAIYIIITNWNQISDVVNIKVYIPFVLNILVPIYFSIYYGSKLQHLTKAKTKNSKSHTLKERRLDKVQITLALVVGLRLVLSVYKVVYANSFMPDSFTYFIYSLIYAYMLIGLYKKSIVSAILIIFLGVFDVILRVYDGHISFLSSLLLPSIMISFGYVFYKRLRLESSQKQKNT